ncbi:MAG: di-trans,poly-cis-decaprenylcistransferase [Acidobacteria bacterium RIFCSPLOWO2_12_FULL_54_10]|nr:MAG: di-trans,poly-cis-decaprenylcistransferase [Acidobacteria bacterium RIFCSPLOWO2_12_FULL_54_10]
MTAVRTAVEAKEDLRAQIDAARLPKHIAIIMDGNGRWARQRFLPRIAGHRMGARTVHEVVETSARLGLQALSLYAFSAENWKRPKTEIDTLMELLREYIKKELEEIHRNNIRIQILGHYELLPAWVQEDIEQAIRVTGKNTGMVLNVALNYSARTELADAFQSILKSNQQNRNLEITEQMIAEHLYTKGLPDPDLLIRTSGEMRVSNFLLWQIAYAEIWVTDTYWPDFTARHLMQAILDFQKRERRYGGLGRGGV